MTDYKLFDDDRILHPLILSGGSHQRGSGKGCAMNAISYIHGDQEITDFPAGVNTRLAIMVQRFNDVCSAYAYRDRERNDAYFSTNDLSDDLFPNHAAMALDLAFLTEGTNTGQEDSVWDRVLQDYSVEYSFQTFTPTILFRHIFRQVDPTEQDLLKYEEQCRFIITRFRSYAGLDTPTIPNASVIDEALRQMRVENPMDVAG